MALHKASRHLHLHVEVVGEHTELVEHLQASALVTEKHLIAQPDRGAVRGAQRGVHPQGLEQREHVAGHRRVRHGDAHAEVTAAAELEHTGAEQQARELRPPAVVRRGDHRDELELDVPREAHGYLTMRNSACARRSESWRTTSLSVATGARTTLTPSALRRSPSTTTGLDP